SGLEWAVVRASWFSQNFSEGEFREMVLNGAITLPVADIPEPFVDVDDIADIAAAALTEDHHNGEVYEVTGPRMLTFRETAQELSRAVGREVTFIPVPKQ
ncbi:NmrA family transcriptional regulator, partial [Nitrosospira sp. NpAV]